MPARQGVSVAYRSICDWQTLLAAFAKAARGKRRGQAVAGFEFQLADKLLALKHELERGEYRPGRYVSFYVHEPKRRKISAAPFRDRVVHHALCNVIEPLFERRFIHDSYANRAGKGTHAALDRCQHFARGHRYVLQCDVQQFFPAIDHELLLQTLAGVIGDPETLWLCRTIIASGQGVLDQAYDMVYFPGDDLFAIHRPRGLPIGNLTSQFWANCFLNPLDHFIKRELKCRAYLRYVDDFLLFDDDKRRLWQQRQAIIDFLAGRRLTLHEQRCQPRPVDEGIPFLGFVVYPHHRLLKRRQGIAYRRRLRQLLAAYAAGEVDLAAVDASVQGWVNHVRYGQTYGLRRQMFRQHPISHPPRRHE